jgi:phenylacetic acid degradation protein paaN
MCYKHKKVCFTEKAGVNCVVIDSAENLDAVLENLAFSISLYSGQMCTAPQNIFIAKDGVMDGAERVSFDDVCARFAKKIEDLATNEKMGPGTLGALQSQQNRDRLEAATALGLPVIHASAAIAQPGFENARTVSPLVLKAQPADTDIYEQEWFGPISFVIPVDDFATAIRSVAQSVRKHGALTVTVYTTDSQKMNEAEQKIISSGAPVAFNYTGPIWVNQSAAFTDFHGAGANPAGNATFADLAFVTSRYNVIGSRVKV